MQLLNAEQLSVKLHDSLSEDDIPRAHIISNGELTNQSVSGAILEAAVKINEKIILFLTDDVPSEDFLNIHLLDHNFRLLDSVTIGSMYSTGAFSDLQFVEPTELHFQFVGDTIWKLSLLPNREFILPFICEPKGVNRKFGFGRHLKISGNPKPNLN